LEIVPDNTFSGAVNLVCPASLPVSPAGALGNPTTCGLSLGTTVTEPLQSTLSVTIVAGTPLMFNMTIQTTTTTGTQTLPTTTPPATTRGFSRAGLLLGHSNGAGNGSGTSAPATVVAAPVASSSSAPDSAAVRFLALLIGCTLFIFALTRQQAFLRKHPAAAVFALALIIITVVGCGGSSNQTKGVTPFTPTGTYQLTVQGSAQNGARGYTCTLIVAGQK
jgi:hypothetical protein